MSIGHLYISNLNSKYREVKYFIIINKQINSRLAMETLILTN